MLNEKIKIIIFYHLNRKNNGLFLRTVFKHTKKKKKEKQIFNDFCFSRQLLRRQRRQ